MRRAVIFVCDTLRMYDDGIDLKNFKKMKHSSYKGGVPVAQRIRRASAGPPPPAAPKPSASAAKASSQPPSSVSLLSAMRYARR